MLTTAWINVQRQRKSVCFAESGGNGCSTKNALAAKRRIQVCRIKCAEFNRIESNQIEWNGIEWSAHRCSVPVVEYRRCVYEHRKVRRLSFWSVYIRARVHSVAICKQLSCFCLLHGKSLSIQCVRTHRAWYFQLKPKPLNTYATRRLSNGNAKHTIACGNGISSRINTHDSDSSSSKRNNDVLLPSSTMTTATIKKNLKADDNVNAYHEALLRQKLTFPNIVLDTNEFQSHINAV